MPPPTSSSARDTLRKLMATPALPALGPGPRAGILPLPELCQKLDEFLSRSAVPSSVHPSIRAAVLLWHDHLDASHHIAQDIPGPDGSLLHGIMHRREPDYSNAKYWFQRVGKHACFAQLGQKAATLLETRNEAGLHADLVRAGEWDPFAFIDACARATRGPELVAKRQLLGAIQAMEFELLLDR